MLKPIFHKIKAIDISLWMLLQGRNRDVGIAGIMYFTTTYLTQQMYIFTFVVIFSLLAQGLSSMATVSRLLFVNLSVICHYIICEKKRSVKDWIIRMFSPLLGTRTWFLEQNKKPLF
ncbi:hypothetical protein MHB84_27260 [Paenibacillus sp. FSL F4-0087]|uniref:hypothetical protein n=1 Tax=Paenibacillus sp. FSL F4-0087 TaxID=2921368 RepID=UPI0030F7AF79